MTATERLAKRLGPGWEAHHDPEGELCHAAAGGIIVGEYVNETYFAALTPDELEPMAKAAGFPTPYAAAAAVVKHARADQHRRELLIREAERALGWRLPEEDF